MCLAVPMQLIKVLGSEAGMAELDGVRYEVNLSLVEEPQVGEYVIVHTGFAIEKLDQAEAEARLELFGQLSQDRP